MKTIATTNGIIVHPNDAADFAAILQRAQDYSGYPQAPTPQPIETKFVEWNEGPQEPPQYDPPVELPQPPVPESLLEEYDLP